MADIERSRVLHHLRRIALRKDGAGLSDARLLEEYLRGRDESALAALVRRHSSMVWGVCRRVLRNYHDAEDAFQATFLVFVRKAASIASPELLANWLYGVAHQTALKARATAAKRKTRERQVKEMPEPAVNTDNDLWNDLQPLLDQELSRLSDKYRSAIVLCDLEGKTRKEAAHQLGVPEGTVAARLARGRKMLAQRLARHGLLLSGGTLAAMLAQTTASASAPSGIVGSTIKAASLFAAGQASAAGAISVEAITLTEGVVKAMFLAKLKTVTAVVLGMGLLGVSWGLYPSRAAAPPEEKQEAATRPPSEPAVPGEEGGNPAQDGQGKKKLGLPKGLPPVQVLVSVDDEGKLRLKAEDMVVSVRTGAPPLPPPALAGQVQAPMPGGPHRGMHFRVEGIGGGFGGVMRPHAAIAHHGPIDLPYDLKEVQILDTKGKEIDKKTLPRLLKDETLAVAAFGEIDPLHLRVLKEGTLVFILPVPSARPKPVPRGEIGENQAMIEGYGAATGTLHSTTAGPEFSAAGKSPARSQVEPGKEKPPVQEGLRSRFQRAGK